MSRHLINFFKANVIFRCRDILIRPNGLIRSAPSRPAGVAVAQNGHRGSAARESSRGGASRGMSGRDKVGCGFAGEVWQCRPCQQTGENNTRCMECCSVVASWFSEHPRNVLVRRTSNGRRAVDFARFHPSPMAPCAEKVVRSQTHLWFLWCGPHRAPVQTKIARRGSMWALGHARTKNEPLAWPGCRKPAQRPAHGAT